MHLQPAQFSDNILLFIIVALNSCFVGAAKLTLQPKVILYHLIFP
jgi:hypothetical protein